MSDQALLDEVRSAAEAVLDARANGGELEAARERALTTARAALTVVWRSRRSLPRRPRASARHAARPAGRIGPAAG